MSFLCQAWLKLAQLSWRRKFSESVALYLTGPSSNEVTNTKPIFREKVITYEDAIVVYKSSNVDYYIQGIIENGLAS